MEPKAWITSRKAEILEGLFTFLRFPSISAQPAYRTQLEACARWLADLLAELGFRVTLHGDPPVVHGYYEGPAGAPTLLFYGHYDVQPPEPLELWESPPFEPTIRQEAIYGRGACDDKGQVWAHIMAWRYWQAQGGLPVSLHVVIEGQEETGSDMLHALIERGMTWHADAGVVSDTAFFAEEIPTLTTSLRGLLYTEISVEGPTRDLHSGSFGGIVYNPAEALARILAELKGPDGRVRVPGFYDGVRAPEERQAWRALPADEAHYLGLTGAPALWGEVGFSPLERATIRPTLDINGLWSGYTGPGSKTIIPAQAHAKVSMRLVPGQDPDRIWQAFQAYVEALAPPAVRVSVKRLHDPAPAFETPTHSPFYEAAARAVEQAFGRPPTPLREGGSIPILSAIQAAMADRPVILMGFGLPSDQVHSPNEHFRLRQLWGGIEAAITFYRLAAQGK